MSLKDPPEKLKLASPPESGVTRHHAAPGIDSDRMSQTNLVWALYASLKSRLRRFAGGLLFCGNMDLAGVLICRLMTQGEKEGLR
jgi:hypothetical protein